jgi:hypothetical protein
MVQFQRLRKTYFSTLQHALSAAENVQVSHELPAKDIDSVCTKLTLNYNHRSGHLKTEHTESLLPLRRHLGNWSRGPAVSMRSELLVVQERLGQVSLLTAFVRPV